MHAAHSTLWLDLLTWLIVGLAAVYVGRAMWARARALLARPAPSAIAGVPGPLGSTLAQPGSPASGCNGCSGSCGSSGSTQSRHC